MSGKLHQLVINLAFLNIDSMMLIWNLYAMIWTKLTGHVFSKPMTLIVFGIISLTYYLIQLRNLLKKLHLGRLAQIDTTPGK